MNVQHSTSTTIADPRQQRAILIAVCVALMAVIAAVSGLNVAQPELAIAFNASQSQILWFINIYTITLSALLLPLGALGDKIGRKPTLLVGLAVFGLASAGAGLATSTEQMLGARLFAGVGAAMIMPITLAVITSTFPDEERSRAIGIWTGVAGGGGILGMFLSATLVDLASWRWLFALPVALVLIAGLMTVRFVPDSRAIADARFDTPGAVLSVIAVVGITFAIHEGPEHGWTATATLLSLAVGIVSGLGFMIWETSRRHPLLDVQLFRDRRLAIGSLALLIIFGVLAGVFVVIFPFFQAVLGWSGLRSTVAMMPMALAMMAASGIAPLVARRFDTRTTMLLGILTSGAGLALMASQASVDGGYGSVLPGMIAMGVGMGLTMTPSTEAITSSLPRERQGTASAVNDVTRELGTALGVALLGAVLSAGYRNAIDTRLAAFPDDAAAPARDGIATAIAAADGMAAHRDGLIRAAQESFVAGWQQAMWIGVAITAALLVIVFFRGPGVQART